jgi:hypothetical protein
METQLHEIDPEGDIIISLGRSNSAFATWHEEQDHPPSILSQPLPDIVDEPEAELEDELEDEFESDSEEPEPANLDLPAENDPISERGPTSDQTDPVGKEPSDDDWASTANVKIRVSSRHLILASPQAKRMLDAAWIEHNTLKSQGLLVMEERDWDEEALLVLMNILHGKTRSVPKIISLEMFAKVAVLVDYYECYEAVEIYSDMWMAHLRNKLPQIYCRDLVLWICISWVFRQPEEFGQVTTFALKYSKGPIQTMELPIPERIVRKSSVVASKKHA